MVCLQSTVGSLVHRALEPNASCADPPSEQCGNLEGLCMMCGCIKMMVAGP